MSFSTGATCPKRCTGTIAWVRSVIARRDPAGSISRYSGSTSTSTGTAPIRDTASAVAMKVLAGRMTSPPARHADRAQGQLERVGAVGDPDAVGDIGEVGVRQLELVHRLAADERRGGEDLGQTGLDLRGDLGVLGGQVDQRDVHAVVLSLLRCGTEPLRRGLGRDRRSDGPGGEAGADTAGHVGGTHRQPVHAELGDLQRPLHRRRPRRSRPRRSIRMI